MQPYLKLLGSCCSLHICSSYLQTGSLTFVSDLKSSDWFNSVTLHPVISNDLASLWTVSTLVHVHVRLPARFFKALCGACAVTGPRSNKGYLGECVRSWEGQRGLSFLQNMELKGGELLVPRAGLYYIYAQTYFRLPSLGEIEGETGETREEEGAQLVQYIYKKVRLCAPG